MTDLIDFTDMTSPEVVTTPSCTEEVAGRDVAQKQLQVSLWLSKGSHFGSFLASEHGQEKTDQWMHPFRVSEVAPCCTTLPLFQQFVVFWCMIHRTCPSTSKRNESASQFEVQGHQ